MRVNFFFFSLLLAILFLAGVNLSSQSFEQAAKLTDEDLSDNHNFGATVAIDGDYAVVGTSFYDPEGNLEVAGVVYVFKRKNRKWKQHQILRASDGQAGDYFGGSVAIKGDVLIVGAVWQDFDSSGGNQLKNSGAAYVFRLRGKVWKEEQKIVASDRQNRGRFGLSIALNDNYAALGAYKKCYVFKHMKESWIQHQIIASPDMQDVYDGEYIGADFGCSVALEGNVLMIGDFANEKDTQELNPMTGVGAVYVYELIDDLWIQKQKLVPEERKEWTWFGCRISLKGEYAIIGTFQQEKIDSAEGEPYETGAAYIYHYENGVWECQQKLPGIYDDSKACGVSVMINEEYAGVGLFTEDMDSEGENEMEFAGLLYMYKRTGEHWNLHEKVVASDRSTGDHFSYSVAIGGNYIICGAIDDDSAYIFRIR